MIFLPVKKSVYVYNDEQASSAKPFIPARYIKSVPIRTQLATSVKDWER